MLNAYMKKANAGSVIAINVVSFGNDPIPLALPVDSTVAEALVAAGVSRGNSEVFVSGEKAENNDILDAGDTISIVSSKQAG